MLPFAAPRERRRAGRQGARRRGGEVRVVQGGGVRASAGELGTRAESKGVGVLLGVGGYWA